MKICPICGKEVIYPQRKYCSLECRLQRNKNCYNENYTAKTRICLRCGKEFFGKYHAATRQFCYDCVPEDFYKQGGKISTIAKQWMKIDMGGKCEICGYDRCLDALDFHHTNPSEKHKQWDDNALNYQEIKDEVKKCILICSNCHREIHAGLRNMKGEING